MITCTIPLPPSLNNAYPTSRAGRRFPSAALKAFKTEAGWKIKAAARGWQPTKGARLALSMILHFPDRRRADIDNRIKAAGDVLAETLGFDDSTIDSITVTRGEPDKANPRCVLTLGHL